MLCSLRHCHAFVKNADMTAERSGDPEAQHLAGRHTMG